MSKRKSNKSKKNTKDIGSTSFWNRNIDVPLVLATVFLLLIGLITLLSASSSIGLSDTGDAYYYVKKQVEAMVIGLVLATIAVFVNYRVYNSKIFSLITFIAIIAFILIVKVSGIDEGGATRWVVIGGVSFQPSEFIKLGMIVLMASLLTRLVKSGEIKSLGKGFIMPLFLAGIIAGMIFFFQNHLSAAFVIMAVTLVQMFVAGISLAPLVVSGGLGIAGVVTYIVSISSSKSDFRSERIQAWLDPQKFSQGKGWQIMQSLYAIGSGGLFGVGMGESRQKHDFLPEPQNDFIASIFAEEFGFFGVGILITIFSVFLIRAATIAHHTTDTFGKLLAIGITVLFGVEIVLNLFVITNIIPVTGIGLPFFSYGGTAMLVNLVAIGILLNIKRESNRR